MSIRPPGGPCWPRPCRFVRPHAILALGALLLVAGAPRGMAAPRPPRSALWFDASRDSTATKTIDGDLSLVTDTGGSLLLGASHTTSPPDQGALDVSAWDIGYASSSRRPVSYSLRFRTWGQSNVIKTHQVSFSFGVNRPLWSFTVMPALRRLRLYTDATSSRVRPAIDLSSIGLGASLWFYGPGYWTFGLEGHSYSYSKDTTLLAGYRAARIFSSTVLTLSDGLLSQSETVDVGYAFRNADVTLEGSRAVSAVDGTHSNVVALKTTYYRFDPVRLGLELGAIHSQVDPASDYATVSLGYAW